MERPNPNQSEGGEQMSGEWPLPGFLTDGESQEAAGREADSRAARIAAAADERDQRDRAEAVRQRLAGTEPEPRKDAHAELGYSNPPDGSLGGALQALDDSAAAQAAEQPRGPYPWDLSEAERAANQTGIPKAREVLAGTGATAEQRRAEALRLERERIAGKRERDANLAEAAKLTGGRWAADEAAEAATGMVDDGPLPIEGAFNTPEEAWPIAERLAEEKRKRDAT